MVLSGGCRGDWPRLFPDSSPQGSVYCSGGRAVRFGFRLYCTPRMGWRFPPSPPLLPAEERPYETGIPAPHAAGRGSRPPEKRLKHRDAERTKENTKQLTSHSSQFCWITSRLLSTTAPAFAVPFRGQRGLGHQGDAAGGRGATSACAPQGLSAPQARRGLIPPTFTVLPAIRL